VFTPVPFEITMTKCKFPQYLGSPLQVLWLETDDLCLFFAFFTLAMIFGGVNWILAFGAPWIYSKLKRRYTKGFLVHFMFIIGLIEFKGYPIYFEKEFYE